MSYRQKIFDRPRIWATRSAKNSTLSVRQLDRICGKIRQDYLCSLFRSYRASRTLVQTRFTRAELACLERKTDPLMGSTGRNWRQIPADTRTESRRIPVRRGLRILPVATNQQTPPLETLRQVNETYSGEGISLTCKPPARSSSRGNHWRRERPLAPSTQVS